MFEQLVESRPKRERTAGEMVASVIVHGVVVVGATLATNGAAETVDRINREPTSFIMRQVPPPAPPPEDRPTARIASAPLPQGFQTVVPPDHIPTAIPPVDLAQRFDPRDFSGRGMAGGVDHGVPGLPVPDSVVTGASFTLDQVDDPATYERGPQPRYPAVLKAAGVEGVVTVEFVVGADGRVEPASIRVTSSTNAGFDAAALEAVRQSSYRPARIAGKAVRQLVRQAVRFTIGS